MARSLDDMSTELVPDYSVRDEFPLMWDIAERYDFAELLGGCNEPLWAEIDAALGEIHSARQFVADFQVGSDE